jgi:L-lysine 2,3-aminomutase
MSKIKSARTLREPAELVARGLAPAVALPELKKVAARYAVAVTPDMAALIDPGDPTIRSHASSFRAPRNWSLIETRMPIRSEITPIRR